MIDSLRAAALLSALFFGGCANQSVDAPKPVIVTTDVNRFFMLYDLADGRPSASDLQAYIDTGSEGLRVLAERRDVTGARMAEAIRSRPVIYEQARECAKALPDVTTRLEASLSRLFEIYPEARSPKVTIAVGRGRPVGIGYPDTGVQIGLEALCAAAFLNPDVEDRFVYVIAHEYVHVQQSVALTARVNGETPTVLDVSLSEGVAEFIGELISGDVAYGGLREATQGREDEIETAFLADKDKTDLSDWVYNSRRDKPGDLGYRVGYRIARAYYENSADKRQAVADMLDVTSPNAFLEKSGWYPGIDLDNERSVRIP